MKRGVCIKYGIDLLMTLTLLFLMSHSLVGEAAHEWAGTVFFILCIIHFFLNARWSKSICRGRYTPYRLVQTLLVVLILLAVVSLMLSGILLSKHIYIFIEIKNLTSYARTVHLLASYWGFVFMSFHLGLHGIQILAHLRLVAPVFKIVSFLFAAYGCYAFFKRSIPSYLLYQTQFVFFDFEEPLRQFFADYIAVMWFFAFIAHLLRKRLKNTQQNTTKKSIYNSRQDKINT